MKQNMRLTRSCARLFDRRVSRHETTRLQHGARSKSRGRLPAFDSVPPPSAPPRRRRWPTPASLSAISAAGTCTLTLLCGHQAAVVDISLDITRLYFTSFPHPAPRPEALNRSESDHRPGIRGQLQASTSATPDDDAKYYYFTIDDQLIYLSFFQDWGPLNLAMVYKACILIHELLQVRVVLILQLPPAHLRTGPRLVLAPTGLVQLKRSTAKGKRGVAYGTLRGMSIPMVWISSHWMPLLDDCPASAAMGSVPSHS